MAPMRNPWTLQLDKAALLSQPWHDWEQARGSGVSPPPHLPPPPAMLPAPQVSQALRSHHSLMSPPPGL